MINIKEESAMETGWDKLMKVGMAMGGAVAGAFGGWSVQLSVLVYFMLADYLTGMAVAWMGKSTKSDTGGPSSKIGFQGILKKLLMLGLVFVAAQIDVAMGGGASVCRDAAVWFYLANEGLSILENLTLAGVPFPERIKALLGHIKQENDSEAHDDVLKS